MSDGGDGGGGGGWSRAAAEIRTAADRRQLAVLPAAQTEQESQEIRLLLLVELCWAGGRGNRVRGWMMCMSRLVPTSAIANQPLRDTCRRPWCLSVDGRNPNEVCRRGRWREGVRRRACSRSHSVGVCVVQWRFNVVVVGQTTQATQTACSSARRGSEQSNTHVRSERRAKVHTPRHSPAVQRCRPWCTVSALREGPQTEPTMCVGASSRGERERAERPLATTATPCHSTLTHDTHKLSSHVVTYPHGYFSESKDSRTAIRELSESESDLTSHLRPAI